MKKFLIFICVCFFVAFGCTKNKDDVRNLEIATIIQPDIEQEEVVMSSLNEETASEERFNTSFDETMNEEEIAEFLAAYFPDRKYQLLEQPLNVNYRKITFAVHPVKSVPGIYEYHDIYDIIVGFEIIDGLFQRYLLIKNFHFINNDDTILMDFSKGYAGIYAFDITYSYPKAEGYTPGLVISVYFDGGDTIADDFTIMWNEDGKKFEKVNFW